MVQTFADRPEWGAPAYHCVNPKRRLKRIFKVFGGYKHPIMYKESPCITWISARIVTFPYHHRKSSGMKK
jgi:hypothetical protein